VQEALRAIDWKGKKGASQPGEKRRPGTIFYPIDEGWGCGKVVEKPTKGEKESFSQFGRERLDGGGSKKAVDSRAKEKSNSPRGGRGKERSKKTKAGRDGKKPEASS